jgi:HEPN domain-containing protein
MATQADLARAWMQKGDSDRLNAERTVQSAGPYDTACFHCQQAVEKYLKAILASASQPIPRTHNLEEVYNECLAVTQDLSLDRTDLSNLTPYAVQLRYDADFWPDQVTAQQALDVANCVRAAVLTVLPPSAWP